MEGNTAMVSIPQVLFVCTHNSARSQIAEGYLNARHGDRYRAFSAGTVRTEVHPLAVEVMREVGIDISTQRSKTLDEFSGQSFDIRVSLCSPAQGICPIFPGAGSTIHKSFPDPSRYDGSPDEMRNAFRKVRDEIIRWIEMEF